MVINLKLYLQLFFVFVCFLITFLMWIKIPVTSSREDFHANIKKEEPVVHMKQENQTKQIPLEEYLIGVVAAEMPASYELEALKAQAIAARTFASHRDFIVDNTIMTQAYLTVEQQKELWKENFNHYRSKIETAVRETEGIVIVYQGEVISAVFSACSNGKTNNADEYWGNEKPYLKSVNSEWDQAYPNYQTKVSFTFEQLQEKLETKNLHEIQVLNTYDSGYVAEVKVDETIYSGKQLREKLQLKSSAFTVERLENGYQFTTYGYGHGIGMSQFGAHQMALQGKKYDEILTHYYTGVELKHL